MTKTGNYRVNSNLRHSCIDKENGGKYNKLKRAGTNLPAMYSLY